MENMSEFNEDRREFFRINDSVYLELKPILPAEVESLAQTLLSPHPSDDKQEKQQLDALQNAFNHLTDAINQTDREVARALRMLDEKINLLAQAVRRQQNAHADLQPTDVNLSAGGISFLSANEYQRKDAFEIKIELRPSGNIIHATANVVGCNHLYDAPTETPYNLRLLFSHMNEHDRNLLVKHTLTRQAEILRAAQNDPQNS